jgi:transposase
MRGGGTVTKARRRPQALLPQAASMCRRHRSAGPHQGPSVWSTRRESFGCSGTRPAGPEPWLKAVTPERADLVVCVAGRFPWDGLADRWAHAGRPFGLGPARAMQAIQGGHATHDPLAAQNIAVQLRGGMLPPAYVSPAAMRATRDLLRRRRHLRRPRAERWAHIQQTNRQEPLTERGQPMADKANRHGGAARVPAPAGQPRLPGDRALLDHDAPRLRDLELTVLNTATQHTTTTRYRLRTVPGSGELLRLVLRYAIQDLHRCPRVQAFVSYCRRGTCAKDSAGKRYGSSGTKISPASLQGAFSEAALLFRRGNPAGQPSLARLEKTHRKGHAFTVFAHPLAPAVSSMRRRHTACEIRAFLHASQSGADAPDVYLAEQGRRLGMVGG